MPNLTALADRVEALLHFAADGPWTVDFAEERRDGGRFVNMVHNGATGIVPIAAVPAGVEGYGREEGRANAELIALLGGNARLIVSALRAQLTDGGI